MTSISRDAGDNQREAADKLSGWGGIRTFQENTENSNNPSQSGAESGAVGAQSDVTDPDLAGVVKAWPTLPAPIRAGIVAMVKAAANGE